jgi:hypothetical protein
MKQANLGLNLSTKKTRKREFLDEMDRVVPWAALVEVVAPYEPEGRRGRPPFAAGDVAVADEDKDSLWKLELPAADVEAFKKGVGDLLMVCQYGVSAAA